MRESTRAKYVVAIFGPGDECNDNFFCWFKEILKRSLLNKVERAQIALDMIEYVLSLAENTPMMLISRKPRNRREVV